MVKQEGYIWLHGREAQPNSGLSGGLFSSNDKAEGSFYLSDILAYDFHPPSRHLMVTRWLYHLWHCCHSSEWKKQRVKGKNLLPFKQLSPTQRFLLPRTGQNSTTGISSCKAGWEIFYVHVSTTLKLRCVV